MEKKIVIKTTSQGSYTPEESNISPKLILGPVEIAGLMESASDSYGACDSPS